MAAQKVRFGLAVFFAVMAVLLFTRDWLWPDVAAKFKGANLNLGAWFALVMAGTARSASLDPFDPASRHHAPEAPHAP